MSLGCAVHELSDSVPPGGAAIIVRFCCERNRLSEFVSGTEDELIRNVTDAMGSVAYALMYERKHGGSNIPLLIVHHHVS